MRNVALLALLVALLALLAVAGWTQPAVGTWKLNPARSTFSGQTRPKTLVVRVEPHPKGEVVTVDRTEVNGQSTSFSSILYFDGAARGFEDAGCSGSQTSRRLDQQSVEVLRQCTSGDWERVVRRLTQRGKELVLEITKQRSGRRVEQRLVLEKQ
jgi:hypothetical protein